MVVWKGMDSMRRRMVVWKGRNVMRVEGSVEGEESSPKWREKMGKWIEHVKSGTKEKIVIARNSM